MRNNNNNNNKKKKKRDRDLKKKNEVCRHGRKQMLLSNRVFDQCDAAENLCYLFLFL